MEENFMLNTVSRYPDYIDTNNMRITITFLSLIFLIISCHQAEMKTVSKTSFDRTCNCDQLIDRIERGFYLKYIDGEDTLYTGTCRITRENGNPIRYKYLKGHILEIIEYYPGEVLKEEMYYDTTGMIIKRVHYYSNGHKSYEQVYGDHGYNSFYPNGRLQRKGGYGFTKEDASDRYYHLYEERLYDSVWKEDGSFDSVYHYSKASITY
jgi:hypothetical protein